MAKIKHATLIEEFEDTKWVIWSCKSKKDRQHNGQNKTCHIQCGMFYFGHCVVCPSLIYSFRLPICYLQTLLSMWHVLFWPLCFLFFFDLELQITDLVSSNSSISVAWFILDIVLSVLWFTASDYPFGIFKLFYQCGMLYFGHFVVCPSLIYSFRLPIWYLQTLLLMWHVLFWPLCCLSFFDLQLQITDLVSSNSSISVAWFILAIVL
jgi:hypothetical protein